MDSVERFRKQQILRSKIRNTSDLNKTPSKEGVDDILNVKIDGERVASVYYAGNMHSPIQADPLAVQALLEELHDMFNQAGLDQLFGKLRCEVIQSIVGPLGIGKLVGSYDKVGGNVDTIHNARKHIYATEGSKASYKMRGEYDNTISNVVHRNSNYIAHNKRHTVNKNTVGIEDAYIKERIYFDQKMDLDHVISAKKTHDDPGRVLSGVSTDVLSNIDENLMPTAASVNRAKKQKSPAEFVNYLENTASSRKKRISDLHQKKHFTNKEKKELNKLIKLEAVDHDAVRAKGELAQSAQDKIVNSTYYHGNDFRKNISETSTHEGVKMGLQQALGLLLAELFTASMDEIRDAVKNGKENRAIFEDIKDRLFRVSKRVTLKWKDALAAFKDGFVSGFISNIVTVLINVFATTSKRLVRMIREGVFSLLNALKIIFFPPEGQSHTQAAHECIKLIASGVIMVGGIALEEIVEKNLIASIPFLAPVIPIFTTIIVGAITGISASLVCYLIDKMDFFGVVKEARDIFVVAMLDKNIVSSLENCTALADNIDELLGR
ncbi:hypothetical protein ACK4A3_18245 [Aeromonas veronii]